jgi:hypothetical protein
MSRTQVAAEFGFSLSFIDHIPAGQLRRYRVGTKVLFDRTEVIAFIKGERPAPLPQPQGKPGRPRKPAITDRSVTQKPQG